MSIMAVGLIRRERDYVEDPISGGTLDNVYFGLWQDEKSL
jgi:hypothetical protein